MRPSLRAWPFESKFLRDFAVVEERHGKTRLFPATEQLPALAKAIEQEFKAGLTSRLAATDGRADDFRKHQLAELVFVFCALVNRARPDHLHVQPYYTPELLTRVAVVQQITRHSAGGNRHAFRFFHGNDFLPDVYLCGKRIVFSGHALERYGERAVDWDCYPVVSLLTSLFHRPPLFLQLHGHQPVFAFEAEGSVVVMPFEETADEFFFLTTLSPDGRSALSALSPPWPAHFHYGPTPPVPEAEFEFNELIAEILERWQRQEPPMPASAVSQRMREASWTRLVQAAGKRADDAYSPTMKFLFYDQVYGPTTITRGLAVPNPKPPPRRRNYFAGQRPPS